MLRKREQNKESNRREKEKNGGCGGRYATSLGLRAITVPTVLTDSILKAAESTDDTFGPQIKPDLLKLFLQHPAKRMRTTLSPLSLSRAAAVVPNQATAAQAAAAQTKAAQTKVATHRQT
jgi:hypothetical protein